MALRGFDSHGTQNDSEDFLVVMLMLKSGRVSRAVLLEARSQVRVEHGM